MKLEEIDNPDLVRLVESHPYTALVLGHLCHATTPSRFVKIIDGGRVRVDASPNGLSPRKSDGPGTECSRQNAISVFDFSVDHDSLFKKYKRPNENSYHSPVHWWSYLCKKESAVTILLDERIRPDLMPPLNSGYRFIEGVERCHDGDISVSNFNGYILRVGDMWKPDAHTLHEYGPEQLDELLSTLNSSDFKERQETLAFMYEHRLDGVDPQIVKCLMDLLRADSEGS